MERTWALRLAAHAQRGEHEVLFGFERTYAETLATLTPAEPLRPLAVYAQIVASIETDVPIAVICADAGLTLAELEQVQRAWIKWLTADPALNLKLGVLLSTIRR